MLDVARIRQDLAPLVAQYKEAKAFLRTERAILERLEIRATELQEAIHVAQTVAQQLQTKAHERIAGIVSQCLSDVFDQACKFEIIWDRKRGKTQGRMVFRQGEHEVDPNSGDGGSAIEISSFAIRVADLISSTFNRRRFLAFDEPFLALSPKHLERVRDMVLVLARELDMQILIITHDDTLKIGKVIKLDR